MAVFIEVTPVLSEVPQMINTEDIVRVGQNSRGLAAITVRGDKYAVVMQDSYDEIRSKLVKEVG